MTKLPSLTHVEIGVSDLDRSTRFYRDVLGLHPGEPRRDDAGHRRCLLSGSHATGGGLELVEVGGAATASDWDRDDQQCGLRHVGLKVADVDAWIERLTAAGVELAAGPFDAFGGVRICFFFDPDGTYLEFVQGYVQHNKLWSQELADLEVRGDTDWDGAPRFDHVAITVPDLEQALRFYRDQLGFGVVGQLVRSDDERGFLITNLRGTVGTLELFSFSAPTRARTVVGASDQLGLRSLGITGTSRQGVVLGSGDVLAELTAPNGATSR